MYGHNIQFSTSTYIIQANTRTSKLQPQLITTTSPVPKFKLIIYSIVKAMETKTILPYKSKECCYEEIVDFTV